MRQKCMSYVKCKYTLYICALCLDIIKMQHIGHLDGMTTIK